MRRGPVAAGAAVGLVAAALTFTATTGNTAAPNQIVTFTEAAGVQHVVVLSGEGYVKIARRLAPDCNPTGAEIGVFWQSISAQNGNRTPKVGEVIHVLNASVPPCAPPPSTTTQPTVPPTTTTVPTPTPTPTSSPTTTMPASHDHGGAGLPFINDAKIPTPAAGESRGEAFTVCPVSIDPRYPCQYFGVEPASSSNNGTGAFRTDCQFSHMAYDDPIVYPGQAGKSHLHSFFGNTQMYGNTDLSKITTTGNSTCGGGILNRTGYWVPTMILPDGTPLAPIENQVYYKTGFQGVDGKDIKPFPTGLRMIAGSAASTGPQQYITYDCKDIGGTNGYSIPSCPAGSVLQMHVQFPQCWNGKDLDSADHKAHMTYPTWGPVAGQNGAGCPSTHPVALPEIGFNIWYRVPAGQSSGAWKLSSDRYQGPGGYSGHGDWINGWNTEIMQTWVSRCLNAKFDCGTGPLGDGRLLGVRP